MFSLNFNPQCKGIKECLTGGGCWLLVLFLALGNAGAQEEEVYNFDDENFLVPPVPQTSACSNCVGELFLKMSEPEIVDGRASIGVLLRATLSSTFTATPYLGNYIFHVAVGGDGIALNDGMASESTCDFTLVDGVPVAYKPDGLYVDLYDPRSLRVSQVAPGEGATTPTDSTHHRLDTDEFRQFGTFSCPVIDTEGVNAYILSPHDVYGFTVQVRTTQGTTTQRKLVLRASNSYRYYPLDGDAPFVAATGDPVDSKSVTLTVTSNLSREVTPTVTNFAFSPGCGVATYDGNALTEDTEVPITTTVTDIKISFGESQIYNDCVVTYDVVVPGNSYILTQRLGEAPPGGDVVSTVVVSLNVGSSSPIQVIDLEAPNLVYSAYANVRTTSGDPLSVSAAYSLDGEKIDNADIGDGVTVQFSDQNKEINLNLAFNAAREAATRRSGANPVQILTLEVKVGNSEPWSKSYLVVSKTAVADGMAVYRDLLNTVITSTEGIVGEIVGEEEVDAGFFLAELLSRSTGAAVIVGQEVIQAELNAAVGVLINLPESGFSSSTQKVLITDAYTFSGSLDNLGVTEASFVIDLGSRQLTSPTRLAKQIRTGVELEQWRGVDNGSGGSVSYSTNRYLLGAPSCLPANAELGWNTDNGLLPASEATPIRCIRITIADDGIYDVDGADLGQPGLSGFISDPIAGVEDSPDIVLAHAGGGGGGGGSDGWIVALAVLGGLLFAGSAGLWMIFALLAILALSLWRRRSEVVAHHRSEF